MSVAVGLILVKFVSRSEEASGFIVATIVVVMWNFIKRQRIIRQDYDKAW